MGSEPDVALSITVCGSPVNRKILPDVPSKWTASRAMLSIFATNHALLKIVLY